MYGLVALLVVCAYAASKYPIAAKRIFQNTLYGGAIEWSNYTLHVPRWRYTWSVMDTGNLVINYDRGSAPDIIWLTSDAKLMELPKRTSCSRLVAAKRPPGNNVSTSVEICSQTMNNPELPLSYIVIYWLSSPKLRLEFDGNKRDFESQLAVIDSILRQLVAQAHSVNGKQ